MAASTVEVLNTTAVNFPRPGHADSYLDPYDTSTEYYYHGHGESFLSKYNISTDTVTTIDPMLTNFLQIKRDWITKKVYGLRSNTIVDLGVDAIEFQNYAEINALQAAQGFYTHPTTLDFFELDFTGKIYFRANSKMEVWSMDSDGSNAVKLFDSDGSGGRGPIASDPHNDDSLVYVDGANIVHRVISTGVTTTIITGEMDTCPGIFLLDGIVYTNYRFKFGVGKGFVILDITGTIIYEYQGSRNFLWSFGFNIDYANKKIYTLDDDRYHEHSYPSMIDLPPNPYVDPLAIVPSSIYATVSWVASNTYYRIDLTDQTPTTTTVITSLQDLEYDIINLAPETLYTAELYTSSDDVTYNLESASDFTTLENTAANFDETLFFDGTDSLYDFENIDSSTLGFLSEIFDEIFSTGNILKLKDSDGTLYESSFVKIGANVDITDSNNFYVPFSNDGETMSITLSDNITVATFLYNSNGSIDVTVDSFTTTYNPGDKIKIDGKNILVAKT